MQLNTTFSNPETRSLAKPLGLINVSRQLTATQKLYVNPDTGELLDLNKMIRAANESTPLTMPYYDAEGRRIQLWKTRQYGLIGTVFSPKGCLTIIPGEKILNPTQSNQSSTDLMAALEKSPSKNWVLALDVTRLAITIWPHLVGAGDQVRPIIVDASPFRHASEKDLIHYLKHQGFKRSDHDPNVYVHRNQQITAHLDREGEGSHVHAEGFKGTHVDFRVKPDLARAMKEERNQKNEQLVNQKKQELDQQVKDKKISPRQANHQLHSFKKEIDAQEREHSSFRTKWRFAYDQERPKNPPGGQQSVQSRTGNLDPSAKDFLQKLQQTRLTDSYNSTHPKNPVPAKGATGGDIGGVACSMGYIEELFEGPEALFERDHVFCFPALPNGEMPCTDAELRQILRELAIGIFTHSAVPFFSLHFNQNADQFPVIHPAYENTLVGRIISMLDYMMKGYLNGGVFKEEFVDDWHHNPDWKTKSDSALQNLIDFSDYCRQHLSGEDQNYKSLRMIQEEFALLSSHSDLMQEFEDKLGASLGLVEAEDPVLKKYSGFKNSFRIISKQKSIKKEGNVFLIDADFDVKYTIVPSPEYTAALEEHFRKYGTLPASYANMDMVYKSFCERMHDHMAKLPLFQKYFAMLLIIDFFSGYFSTLKKYRKIPVLPAILPTVVTGCPPLFPHLPISTIVQETLQLNMHAVLNNIIQKHRPLFHGYCKQLHAYLLTVGRKPTAEEENAVLIALKTEIQNNIISSSSLLMRRVITKKVKESQNIQDEINKLAYHFLESIQTLMESSIKTLPATFLSTISDGFAEATMKAILKEAIQSKQAEFERFFSQIHKDLLIPSNKTNPDNQVESAIETAVYRHISRPKHSAARTILDLLRENFQGLVERITSSFEILPTAFEDKREDFAKMPLKETRVKSEMKPEEVETGIKLVGGCGVHLQQQAIQTSRLATQILRFHWSKFQKMHAETWTKVSLNNDQSTACTFRLMTEDVPAWIHDDYTWMESLLIVPKNIAATEIADRLAIEEAMTSGDKEGFTKLVNGSKNLTTMKDSYQRTLMHHAVCLPDPFYTQTLLSKGLSNFAKDIHGYIPTHYAAMNGAIAPLQLLLKGNIHHVNATSHSGSTPTIVAIQHSQQEVVHFLLMQGAAPRTVVEGYSTLHCALHHGDFAIINDVLATPAIVAVEINQLSEEGGTPLTLACELDNPDLVEKMIALKADPTIKRKDGISAIEVGIKRDCIPVVKCLLKYVALTPHAIDTAAKEGSIEMLAVLTSLPAFYSHRNSYQDTTLHISLRFGNLAGALFITKSTHDAAYLSAENDGKETAFSLAAALGAWDLMEELMNKKAVSKGTLVTSLPNLLQAEYNPTLKTMIDMCQLDVKQLKEYALMAAQVGNYQALSFIFVPSQVELDTLIGPNDWRVLHYLAKFDGLALFRMIIVKEKSLLQPLQKEGGKTVSYIAASHGSTRVLRLLLELMKKGNITLERHFKDRHLFYGVIQSASKKNARVFLEIYSDKKKELVNAVLDQSGIRPVLLAAKMGSLGLVKLFLREEADVKAADANGDNALCHALRANATSVVKHLLKEYGAILATPQALFVAAVQPLEENLNLLLQFKLDQGKLDHALFLSVQEGHATAFNRLRSHGATFNFVRDDGMTSLLVASGTGQSNMLSIMLTDKTLKHTTLNGNNALHEAARNHQTHCVTILMLFGYKNEPNQQRKSILELSGNCAGLKILLKNKDAYKKASDELATAILKKENLAAVVNAIHVSSLNEPIQMDHEDEIIWGTPFQLLLRIHKKAVPASAVAILFQRADLDPNRPDSDGNTLAHLLLKADIFPKLAKPINWALVNKEKENPLHIGARHASQTTLLAVLEELKHLNVLALINGIDHLGRTPIYDAIDGQKEANIKLLVEYGADLNWYDHRLITPLISACASTSPSLGIIKSLLAAGANPNINGTPDRVSPLQISVGMKRDEIARCLLFNGASCQTTFSENSTLVHATAQSGNTRLLRLFIARGLSIDSRDHKGMLPIHHASLHGETDTVKSLLAMQKEMLNAVVEGPQEQDQKTESEKKECAAKFMEGATPLFLAASQNKSATMQFLLKQQADTEVQTKQSSDVLSFVGSQGSKGTLDLFLPYKLSRDPKTICSALGQAIASDNLDIVMLLYERGVPINTEILNGFTGIQLAAQCGSLLSTQWLLQQGADPLLPGPTGEDALQLSAANDSWIQFSLILEFVEPNLEELRNNRETLLHTASKAGKLIHVMFLLSHYASINIKDSRGNLPIHLAVQSGHAPVASMLLACGADSTVKTPNGKILQELVPLNDTAMQKAIREYASALSTSRKQDSQLHFAVRCQNPQAVLLQTRLVEVDKTNKEGATALHVAVEMEQEASCLHLLQAGANVNAKDGAGRTPLSIAKAKKLALAELLENGDAIHK